VWDRCDIGTKRLKISACGGSKTAHMKISNDAFRRVTKTIPGVGVSRYGKGLEISE